MGGPALGPDWRWLRDREDSPWYPSLRLFRQHRRGEWAPVFARIAAALTQQGPQLLRARQTPDAAVPPPANA